MEGRKELLLKPIWDNSDIAIYVNCGVTKASQIRQRALMFNGFVELMPKCVKRDAVLKALGLDFANEVKNLKIMED